MAGSGIALSELNEWSRDDGTTFLNLNDQPDSDALFPESDVTKQCWMDPHQDIEHRKMD